MTDSRIRSIAISTGGGDAPGVNAVIRATVLAAENRGWECWGIRDGYHGLLEPQAYDGEGMVRLTRQRVSGIAHLGGTILGTTNRGDPLRFPVTQADGSVLEVDRGDELVAKLKAHGCDALVAVGGDGSLAIACELGRRGLRIVGVPKTIDNDLERTAMTFGFDTAVSFATECLDRLHSTAASHHRIMVVEVMGRDAGWIALEAGIAGGAHVILIPEIPFTIESVCKFVKQRESYGKRFTIMVVAEGVKLPLELKENRRAGSVGNLIGHAIASSANKEVRISVLGHIQRGGTPTAYDRILATRFGVAAVDLIAQGGFGRMVCLRNERIEAVDIAQAIGKLKTVDPNGQLVQTAKAIGISFGD